MVNWKQIQAAKDVLSRETGTVYKDPGGKLTVALAYPNSYYVGMSSLALQILYRAFNQRADVACERVFWNEGDAGARTGAPLVSLESQSPLRNFDIWAFTVSYEMDYFNVVAMLRQAGVPPLSAERRAESQGAAGNERLYPLLIAGGPGISMNPEPMAPFFDVLIIGEGEELVDVLVDIVRDGLTDDRERMLDALEAVPGVYIPERLSPQPGGRRIQRRWVRDTGQLRPVSSLYTPDTEFSAMHLIEIARGCGRGCRFCLAGYAYRPVREQPLERILGWVKEEVAQSKRDGRPPHGIGLVSAAVSDHSQIDILAGELQAMGLRVSASSMRTDPISVPLVHAMAAGGTQTLTIAPEAGSERLRRAINKSQSEDDLLAAVELARSLNFSQLKLYFMLGHPTEEEEDIQAIVDLTLRARGIFRRNVAINATPFVPKAQTPFERTAMAAAHTIQARQNMLKRALARHQVAVRADSAGWAEVQGVLARGDRRLAQVLLDTQPVSVRGFQQALRRHGLSAAEFLGERAENDFLPWEAVEGGVRPTFLKREYALAQQSRLGYRCPPPPAVCSACGVC